MANNKQAVPTLDAEFFTVGELAQKWHVSDATVFRLCREKKLSHTKIRGRYMISQSQANEYLREQTVLAQ